MAITINDLNIYILIASCDITLHGLKYLNLCTFHTYCYHHTCFFYKNTCEIIYLFSNKMLIFQLNTRYHLSYSFIIQSIIITISQFK